MRQKYTGELRINVRRVQIQIYLRKYQVCTYFVFVWLLWKNKKGIPSLDEFNTFKLQIIIERSI